MIFYADDDLDDLEIFREIANQLKVELKTFENGQQLLDELININLKPKLIFLDINMPGYNGLQILEMIRHDLQWHQVPIIMFSTSGSDHVISESLALGATFYLRKFSDYAGLKRALSFILNRDWKYFKPDKDNFVYCY